MSRAARRAMRRLSRGPCAACGEDTGSEDYMVHDHIWRQHGPNGGDGTGLLCVGCLERRMGRELWSGDFPHVLLNVWNDEMKSDRLVDRLRRVTPTQ